MDEEYQSSSNATKKLGKQYNILSIWGNEASMNLNPLVLANIQGSSYFKVHLFKLKTYHEVVDEIYYQVKHMEPWERGSRKTSGQTGMCGGVRGVGAGGIVSTAYCLLYKLYTLRLTRKQVNGLLNHTDSPYIRALGFMYLRYTQQPGDLYDWYEEYLQDEEEIDVKAGGGQVITIGQMVYQFLTKLDWFSTLFPRIPVPIQKQIEKKLEQYCRQEGLTVHQLSTGRTGAVGNVATFGGGGDKSDWEVTAEDDDGYTRRGWSGGGGGNTRNLVPPSSNHSQYVEHDDRSSRYTGTSSGGPLHQHRSRRREERRSLSSQPLDRNRDRYREKHKKKRKHKHRSRSPRSQSRSPYQRRRSSSDRVARDNWERERSGIGNEHRERSGKDHSGRRHR